MKKYIGYLLLSIVAFTPLKAQENPLANQVANRIAQYMADTLKLTADQQSRIYNANIQLNNQKNLLRKTEKQSNMLQMKIQQIENKRDSIYKTILSKEKYLLYRQKKQNLIKAE
jgi:hypothetical protein